MTGDPDPLLDRPLAIGPVERSPAAVCARLRELGIRACCLDDPEQVTEQVTERAAGQATGKDDATPSATVRGLLDDLVATHPSYRWELAQSGLVNVFPARSVLDDPVPGFVARGDGLWRVLERLRLQDHGIELFQELGDGDGPALSVEVAPGSLRSALNAVVAPVDGAVWHLSGSAGAWFLTVAEAR
jgi:hypothetical protein